jgi:hypothetical protein
MKISQEIRDMASRDTAAAEVTNGTESEPVAIQLP